MYDQSNTAIKSIQKKKKVNNALRDIMPARALDFMNKKKNVDKDMCAHVCSGRVSAIDCTSVRKEFCFLLHTHLQKKNTVLILLLFEAVK